MRNLLPVAFILALVFLANALMLTVTFVAPTPANGTYSANYVYVNATVTGVAFPIDVCTLEWSGANETMTQHGSGVSVFCTVNKTLGNGNYSYRVFANDSSGDQDASETRHAFINATGYLEANLTMPMPGATTNVIQNTTFNITVNVTCIGGVCGVVNATPRYNISGSEPDTLLNASVGEVPFHNATGAANQSCGVLLQDETCQLSWLVNATGGMGLSHNIDVLLASDVSQGNNTANAEIFIMGCSVDFTLHWTNISFGVLVPGTQGNAAPGNDAAEYNISVNDGSCALNLTIRGDNLTNTTLPTQIGVGNLTWSNSSNDYASSAKLSGSNALINASVPAGVNVTTWYWLDVPPVFAGRYNSTIYITGAVA